jgi:hypothetical protein
LLVLVCSQVVLPNHPPPAATIIVDRASRKIKDVLVGVPLAEGEERHPESAEEKEVESERWENEFDYPVCKSFLF